MGLGVYVEASLPGEWRRKAKRGKVVEELEECCRAAIDDALLRRLARFRPGEDGGSLDVWLHPATEPIEFRVDGDLLVCSAKTSPAGPGYHVYVVELLERMATKGGIEWRWTDDDGETGDECSYHESRSFEGVHEEMLRWLRGLASSLGESDIEEVCISLPFGFSPKGPGSICTPLGPLDLTWPRQVLEASESQLEAIGAAFFPWWGRELDARSWMQYGMAVAWVDITWHAPASDDEVWAYEAALAAFDQARSLDPGMARPDIEMAEMRRCRSAEAGDPRAPNPAGIGYRRGLMRWALPGDWTIELPGYWYEELDENGTVLWFGDRTIRVTTFTAEGASTEQLLAAGEETPAAGKGVEWRSSHLAGRGSIEWADDDDGCWLLSGQVATDGHLCVATIAYTDEADRAWAEETFRTISHPPPE
jgi:hypothetical protein